MQIDQKYVILRAMERNQQEREDSVTVKRFNTKAVCIPSKHYMVDLTGKVAEIKKMVDAGEYFTINRAR